MGDVQGHRDDVVITVHRDQIHDAVLAEFLDRLAIERVVHFVVPSQLRGEFPDDRLIVLHLFRLPAGAERCDDFRIEARLDRERGVRVPLILRAPILRGHDDRHLVEALVERGVEADIFADLLQAVSKLRTAQPGIERAAHALAWSGHDRVRHGALGGRHLV